MVSRESTTKSAHLAGVIQSGDWDGLQIRWCLAAQRFDSSSPAFMKSVYCRSYVLRVCLVLGQRVRVIGSCGLCMAFGLLFKARVREGRFLGEGE